ncbi:hypothetical protein M404DRAFT_35457 [Pisolithus tinctorius Marx 270]|uniref:Uncharacterized protein n=1 Tax=Pisolithus tinctorius Marx 270 TaxID=870435 RepID=A0A0C3IAE1_PISTI|nr:hypothetical protein M404DRAFT_35457 [Pisolithus tinctorius Marx 270]
MDGTGPSNDGEGQNKYVICHIYKIHVPSKDFPPPGTFYRRPLLAMISLIESKKGKYKSAEDADHMPAMDERDNMRKEIANESEAAKKIILHLKKALQVTDAERELETGSWWDRGSVCELFDIFEKYKSA